MVESPGSEGIREIQDGLVDETMDGEIASGPDIQRFLEDQAKATEEYARKKRVSFAIPRDHYTKDRNCATEYADIDDGLDVEPSVFAGLASCCNAGCRTTVVGQDPKGRIVQAGGWKTIPFIWGSEIGERLGSTAIIYSLIVYLTSQMKFSFLKAVYISSASFGLSSLAPLLGIFLADAYLGRVSTIVAGSTFYFAGLALFTLVIMLASLRQSTACDGRDTNKCAAIQAIEMAILFVSLTLQTIGSGGIRPCVALCGADQFDESNPEQQQRIQNYFSWYKACMASAMIIAATVIIYIQIHVGWDFAALFLVITMVLSLAVLLFGLPSYRTFHANGSPLTSLVQVLVAAIRKRKLSLPENPNLLYQVKTQDVNGVLLHTENMRWLDKAAVLEQPDISLCPRSESGCWKRVDSNRSNSWMLCTVHQVEELKRILRMGPVWLCTSFSAIVYIQTFTTMTKQAMTMDLTVSKHFTFPPSSMGAFSILTFLLFASFYDAYLVKILRKLTRKTRGLTCLQRIGVGIFIGVLTMVVAAIVENRRKEKYSMACPNGSQHCNNTSVPHSGFMLVPQFVLAGLGESFVVPGLLEFFDDETPSRLQGMGKSVTWAALGMGGILNIIMVSILELMTRTWTGTSHGWLEDNGTSGRVDYFYCALAILGALVFLVYFFIASSYAYTAKTYPEPGHIKLERTCVDTLDDLL